MANLYDLAYGLGVALASPLWLARGKSRRKVLAALRQRRGVVEARQGDRPAVLIHAVSVGEVNATTELVRQLQQRRPDLQIIVSTTSDTGYARAQSLYGSTPSTFAVRFPLDFTGSINRWLDALRPAVVVLMEGELWPNFLRQCAARHVPVLLVNGRMTTSAFGNYRLAYPIAHKMMQRLTAACVQDDVYRQRFAALGMPVDRLHITGTMKFDTAAPAERVMGDQDLAAAVGLPVHDPRRPVWVCGSTGPGEEEILLGVYRGVLGGFPGVRLVIVPRHPERFDAVAGLIAAAGFAVRRRSAAAPASPSVSDAPVVLGDTMGELRKFYSLATVVFVGRTLLDLGPRQHGSDMIEPAALAKPVAVGPWTQNFAEVMRQFRIATAMAEVNGETELNTVLAGWLTDPAAASRVGRSAQAVVRVNQGATAKHADMVLTHLSPAARGES
jgi:3-deoxy-D-manno-octulosonic-acid transferase